MSIYLNYDVEVEGEKIITAAFSNTDIPVLAVSTNKNKITFFQEDASLVPDHDLTFHYINIVNLRPEKIVIKIF